MDDLEPMEKQTIRSIRHKLKRYNLVLRASYKGYGYQMFKTEQFQQATSEYTRKMKIYSLIRKLNGQNPQWITQNCLANIVTKVETTLDDLFESKCLNMVQLTCMELERSQVQLNYLYFVPDNDTVCSVGLSFIGVRWYAFFQIYIE